MRRAFFIAFFALCVGSLHAEGIFPYQYQETVLDNGLRVILIPIKNEGLVSYFTVVRAGSRDEVEPGKTGFAHFFEHMMFRGTKKYPAEKFGQMIGEIGADRNAFTGDDFTGYYMHFPGRFLETVIDLESDRFMNLSYALPAFQTEAKAVLGEYNKNFANPFFQLEEKLNSTAFTKSTYAHTAMGFLKDIQDMPNQYDYSQKFFDRYYRPEYTTILVVGDVKAKPVRDLVDKYWGEGKRGSHKAEIPQEPAQTAPRSAEVKWPAPTLPILTIAFKSPAYTDSAKDTAALSALSAMAFSASSDLYQKLVVQDQKLDALFASAPNLVDPGLFQITARVKKAADMDGVRDEILATIRGFQEKPVDAARLEAVRKRLRYSVATQMQSADAIAAILASFVALRRTPETMNKLYEQYASLTADDVKQAAAKYLVEPSRTIVTLTAGGPR